MGRFRSRITVATGVILAVALLRLVPHPPNVAPVTALALFAGATFGRRMLGFFVPLAAMLLSDSLLELLTGQGFHPHMPVVYGTFALVVLLGSFLSERLQVGRVALASVAASTLFYLTTNFAVWASGTMYPHTVAGLLACYIAALPFYGLSLVGDLTFAALIFAAYSALVRHLPAASAS